MKRWCSSKGDYVENSKVDNFIEDIKNLSKKYGLTISHEDGHGAFRIEEYSETNITWLDHAHCDINKRRKKR